MCLAMIRLSVGVAMRRAARSLLTLDPLGTGKLQRHDSWLQPRSRPRGVGLPLKRQHSSAPFLDVVSPLYVFFPTCRVVAVASMRPQVSYPATAGSRSVVTDLSLAMQCSSLLRRLSVSPPRINISEVKSPSDRAVSKDTCVGGCGAISPPIAPPPPQRPPLGLLPDHTGSGSREFPTLTTRRWADFL